MSEIIYDPKKGSFLVSNYDGLFDKKISQDQKKFGKENPKSSQWGFFRERSNHAYMGRGNISCGEHCCNNLIISLYGNVKLNNTRNAFIFVGNSHVEISPIFCLQNVINKGLEKLSSQEIKYNTPRSVFERENLSEKDLGGVAREIKQRYGVEQKKISMIPSKSKMGGIYYIYGKDGHRYILKYRSKNKERAELLSVITANIPDFFPRIYHRKDDLGYTFEMEDGWYGLESFVEGSFKERDLDYFLLLGGHIVLLHRQLANFSQDNRGLERTLLSKEGHISESSIASIYLDLAISTQKHNLLLFELEKIIDEGLSSGINSLPKSLIHRDLNHSNIIWVGRNPKIIDSEFIRISARVNEFMPPLILLGNMRQPRYIKGGLLKLIDSYNSSSEHPLSEEEKHFLPILMKYYLLKYYVVRTIRRAMESGSYLNELEESLKNWRG